MYKMFIVDDEKWVVESLKAKVEWHKHNFSIVGQAYNAYDALEQIKQLRPHLVITDIRMPGMDGLDLIKRAKEEELDPVFVVVSGYADFVYAQKAILYGAAGYILKTFEDTEIIELLTKVRNILNDKEASRQTEFVSMLQGNKYKDDRKIVELMEKAGFRWMDTGVSAVVTVGGDRQIVLEHINWLPVKIGKYKYAYLFTDQPSDLIAEKLRHSSEKFHGIGFGTRINEVSQIDEAIQSAIEAAYQYFIHPGGVVYFYGHSNFDENMKKTIGKIYEAIIKKNIPMIHHYFLKLEAFARSGNLTMKHSLSIYNAIISFLCNLTEDSDEDFVFTYDELADLFPDVFQMFAGLKEMIAHSFGESEQKIQEHSANETYVKIISYIDANFTSEISIRHLAQKFHLNYSYISQLFRKESGQTFTLYITQKRIEYACKLLKETDLPINEVAEVSGFVDYFHFARVFKKNTSLTPTEFRKGCSE